MPEHPELGILIGICLATVSALSVWTAAMSQLPFLWRQLIGFICVVAVGMTFCSYSGADLEWMFLLGTVWVVLTNSLEIAKYVRVVEVNLVARWTTLGSSQVFVIRACEFCHGDSLPSGVCTTILAPRARRVLRPVFPCSCFCLPGNREPNAVGLAAGSKTRSAVQRVGRIYDMPFRSRLPSNGNDDGCDRALGSRRRGQGLGNRHGYLHNDDFADPGLGKILRVSPCFAKSTNNERNSTASPCPPCGSSIYRLHFQGLTRSRR